MRSKSFYLILIYTVLLIVSVLMLMPLFWLLNKTFTAHGEFFEYQLVTPPGEMTTGNFDTLFSAIPFLRFMLNSIFIAGCSVMVQLFFSSLGGFALAKYEFRGKRMLIFLMLATLMIPGEVMLAPLFGLIYDLGMMNSYAGVIIPGMVSVFGMFLFRQSMLQIPDELLQSARIDGCSEFGIWWRMALPVSRPMIGAFCLIAFMGSWNSYIWPQIILHSESLYPLPIGVSQMVGTYREDYGALMAGTLLSILPVVGLFFLLQKEFISGLTSGAVKG